MMRALKVTTRLVLLVLVVAGTCLAKDINEPNTALSSPVKQVLLCPTSNIIGGKGANQDDRFQLLAIDGTISFKPDCNPPATHEVFQIYATFVTSNSSAHDDKTDIDNCSGFVKSDETGRYHVIVPITKSYEDRTLTIIACTEPVYTCSVVSVVVNGWKKTRPRPMMSASELSTMMTMKPSQLPIGYVFNFNCCVADDNDGTVRWMTRNRNGVPGPDGTLKQSPPVPKPVNDSFKTTDDSGVTYKYNVLSPDLMEDSIENEKPNVPDSDFDENQHQPKSTPAARKARGIYDGFRGRIRTDERQNEEAPMSRDFQDKNSFDRSIRVWLKRNWNDAGMGWIKRNEDKRNWNEAGMGWIKRNDRKGDSRVDWRDRTVDTPNWMSSDKDGVSEWMNAGFHGKPESDERESGRNKRSSERAHGRHRSVAETFKLRQKE